MTPTHLSVAFIVASANDYEKKHAPDQFDETVEAMEGQVKRMVADPLYSIRKFREKAAGVV